MYRVSEKLGTTTEGDALDVQGPYAVRPDRKIEEALREHIRKTGTPESFPGIILKPLPSAAKPELVLRNYTIDRSKRQDGQYAPCAQCSPNAPKFLTGGVIWCPDGWLRQFGGDCVEKAIGGAAYREMTRERQQLEDERDADEFLLANWSWVNGLRAYVQSASLVAAALVENREAIDTKLKGWRSKVRTAAKSSDSQLVILRQQRIQRDESGERIGPRGFAGSDGYETVQEVIGPFVGRIVVSPDFDPVAWVQKIAGLIPAGCWGSADDAFEVTADWSMAQRVERVRQLREMKSEAASVSRKLEEGRLFFTTGAMRTLGQWGGHKEAALPFTIRTDVEVATIQYDGKACRVRLLERLHVPEFTMEEFS